MCNWLQAAWATPPHNANVTFILKCREVTFDGWYSDGLYYAATEDENYITFSHEEVLSWKHREVR